MASITKTTTSTGTRWRARYRSPDGKSRERWFERKVDAEAFLTSTEHSKMTGGYVDPGAGRVTVGAFAREWLAAQTFDESTREAVELRVRVHIEPTFGGMELRAVRPSTVQAWLRGRQEGYSPRYVRVMLANLSAIFGAAVEDELITKNPCTSSAVRAPAIDQDKVVPWTADEVAAVIDATPERYRAIPLVAAAAGLRQGEVFGLRVSDVDFLRRTVHVRQQVKIVRGVVMMAPPKRGKTREVPLADALGFGLAEQLRAFPAVDGGLIFTSREGKPINRGHFNRYVWKPALVAAGVEPSRPNGMHALRHYFASVLLDGGVSVRTLADYLGHSDPGFTLRVYTHLMPAFGGPGS
ncbi:MAG: tyrosine-type recombinase/integrase [Iamia sp.]